MEGLHNVIKKPLKGTTKIIEVIWKHWGVSCVIGPPGIGKSKHIMSIVRKDVEARGLNFITSPTLDDWAEEGNHCFLVVLASQMESIDVKGIPVKRELPDGKSFITVFSPTELFPPAHLVKAEGTIFFDELPSGDSMVQSAVQQVIEDRAAGNFKLSDKIRIIAAGNRPEDNSGVFNVLSSLRNRMAWMEVLFPSVDEFHQMVDENGLEYDIRFRGYFSSPSGRKFFTGNAPKAAEYAYLTPRSVMKASKVIDGIDDIKLLRDLVGAYIGDNIGADFSAFIELAQKVNMDEIYKNPKLINKYEGDPGTMYSISVELATQLTAKKKTKEIMNILAEIEAKEYGMFILSQMLANKKNNDLLNLLSTKEGERVATKYASAITKLKAQLRGDEQ
jgi:hypothetical protein